MKRRLLKIGKWLLIVILISAIVNGVGTVIMGRRYAAAVEKIRAEGGPVSILEIGGPPVAAEDNAAPIYQRAFDKMNGKRNERQLNILSCVPGKVSVNQMWDPKSKPEPVSDDLKDIYASPEFWTEAGKAADHFANLVPTLEAAAAKRECQWPVHWDQGFDAKLPHYAYLRSLTRMLSAQAILQARNGQGEQALKTLGLTFRMVKNSCNDRIMIATLVRSSMTKYANDALLDVLQRTSVTPEQGAAWNAVLQDTDYGKQCAESLKSERALFLWGFSYVMRGGFSDLLRAPGVQNGIPNLFECYALALLGRPILYADGVIALDNLNKQIKVGEEPYRSGKQLRLDKKLQQAPSWAIITHSFTPIFSQCRAKVDETRARTAITQIVLAAKVYKARMSSYPSSLKELKAKTDWKLPVDPFSGKDLIYRRAGTGFIVYSIGMNLKDDGGTPGKSPVTINSAGLPVEGTPTGDIVLHWQ